MFQIFGAVVTVVKHEDLSGIALANVIKTDVLPLSSLNSQRV